MFDKFGEFDSTEELNKAAAGLKEEGDEKSLYELAAENGIAKEDVEMLYGEPFPKKEAVIPMQGAEKAPVAPVQQNKSKVTKAKTQKDMEKPKKPENTRKDKVSDNAPVPADPVLEETLMEDTLPASSSTERVSEEQTEPVEKIVSEKTMDTLRREAENAITRISDYFMEILTPEDITLEELQGIRVKADTLSMILDQMITLKKGEK